MSNQLSKLKKSFKEKPIFSQENLNEENESTWLARIIHLPYHQNTLQQLLLEEDLITMPMYVNKMVGGLRKPLVLPGTISQQGSAPTPSVSTYDQKLAPGTDVDHAKLLSAMNNTAPAAKHFAAQLDSTAISHYPLEKNSQQLLDDNIMHRPMSEKEIEENDPDAIQLRPSTPPPGFVRAEKERAYLEDKGPIYPSSNGLHPNYSDTDNPRYSQRTGKRLPFKESADVLSSSMTGKHAMMGMAMSGIPGAVSSLIGTGVNFLQNQQSLNFQKQVYSDTQAAAREHHLPNPNLGLSGAYMTPGMYTGRKASPYSHMNTMPPPGSNSLSPIWGNN